MKNVLLALLAITGMSFAATLALADTEPTACSMSVDVTDGGFIFGGGGGQGTINCVGADGRNISSTPVRISIHSFGAQLGVFHLVGVTANLGIQDPRDIFGTYGMIAGQAGLVIAAGGQIGLQNKDTGMNINLTLQVGEGVGVNASLMSWDIQPANIRQYRAQ